MRNLSLVLAALAASMALPPLAASADELQIPPRKPGQWELNIQPAGMPHAIVSQICLDEATDKALMTAALSFGTCEEMKVTHEGDSTIIDATCAIGGATSKSHSVISGDFQSAYEISVTSDRVAGTSKLPKHSELKQTATWTGPCAEGMQPGDMLMPNGMKVNALKVMKPAG